ncbi:cytochrome P450 78A5-like [Nicotiana tabacum]|uniref:Cytochrome P450 78A5-like n=1 Tax=Nicotiana tabacum TaxID=4097 RepID=A0A1S4B3U5_TOBAC|nr:PREDICTED: cytochrome P450 78A5-like [Nicotiana tabacum]
MKPFMLASISLFIFLFIVISYLLFQANPWPFTLATLFSLFLFLLNFWLVPGGFAWRNYIHYQKHKILLGPFSWPLLGFLPQMGSHAHRKLATLATSLGSTRLMIISLGATRVIISSHPDTAKEILCGTSFANRPVKESAKLLMFERAIGFAPYESYWRNLRRIAANLMFSPRRISSFEGLRQLIADNMIEGVVKEMNEIGFVEVRGILRKGSLSNIMESVFGSTLGLEGEKLGLMVKEGYELIGEFNWSDYFPLRFLDFWGTKRRCHKLAAQVNELVGEIVKERRREGELNMKNDFLSLLLSLAKEDQLTDADMVAVLWEMVFRGTDTVAILLEWIMARMVLHQDVQAKAQKEIDTCVGHNKHVRDSDIQNLPYLQAIVKEVLRLHPPGPLLSWARLTIHDTYVDKCFIPAGTTAMVNMWAITHDSTIWEDPWAFKPERLCDKEEDISIMGSDLRLAPFGSGRRVCPGRVLGLATVHLWLARLLQQFKWLPSKPVDLAECLKLSLEMEKPLACRAFSRYDT